MCIFYNADYSEFLTHRRLLHDYDAKSYAYIYIYIYSCILISRPNRPITIIVTG